jgi:hypothetical protein
MTVLLVVGGRLLSCIDNNKQSNLINRREKNRKLTFDGGGEVLESRAELLVELLVGHELVRHEPGGQALVPRLVLSAVQNNRCT